MNINLDLDLFVYGLVLAVLGGLAHWLAPDYGYAMLIMCIAGGVLVAILGVLGLRGFRRRNWPIGTLVVLDIALLVQAVQVWRAVNAGTEALKPVAVILTVLLVGGITTLFKFVQASREH